MGLYSEEEIKQALRECFRLNPGITANNSLVLTTFTVLKEFFVADKNYVLLEAPTGSGKSIIGFVVHFCITYLQNSDDCKTYENLYGEEKLCPSEHVATEGEDEPMWLNTYFLTSSKMLQEQLDNDLDRFDFRDYASTLKGTANYLCTKNTEDSKQDVFYPERYCIGMKASLKQSLPCFSDCPYICKRNETSTADCAILNYSYFLTVMRSSFKPFFRSRVLTISDEAHLLPEIVLNQFNYEFTKYLVNRIIKVNENIIFTTGSSTKTEQLNTLVTTAASFFLGIMSDPNTAIEYLKLLGEIKPVLKSLLVTGIEEEENTTIVDLFGKQILTFVEDIESAQQGLVKLSLLLEERTEDVFFQSDEVTYDSASNSTVYKHIIRDMSEAQMVKDNFLVHTNKALFMSATLGDVDEYAMMIGLEKNEYSGFRLASTFDFSNSPIYLCNSGWLNYANFKTNIDGVIMQCIHICNTLHPNEKGIIHTSTFTISKLLEDKVLMKLVKNPERFLFYTDSDSKEKCVQLMKTGTKPYIIVGPSLYEGLDLKDDQGRFNILIKVPYAGLTPYLRKKIERFPFWYLRNTLEKIIQAIGRTNRNVNDYSKTYLLDSGFNKLIFSTPEHITKRVQYLKLQ